MAERYFLEDSKWKQTGDVSSDVFFDANASGVLVHLVSIQYPALANLDRCTCASNEGALRLKLDFLAQTWNITF
jgi:hypothetical protein